MIALWTIFRVPSKLLASSSRRGPAGARLRKQREDRKNLEEHISHLETKIADLKPAASAKPSPVKGMAMLRRGRAKSDLAKAKNKRQKENA